jgi:hypothetical protein
MADVPSLGMAPVTQVADGICEQSNPNAPAAKSAMPAPSSARRNLLEPANDDLQHLSQTIQAVAGGRLPDEALASPAL